MKKLIWILVLVLLLTFWCATAYAETQMGAPQPLAAPEEEPAESELPEPEEELKQVEPILVGLVVFLITAVVLAVVHLIRVKRGTI